MTRYTIRPERQQYDGAPWVPASSDARAQVFAIITTTGEIVDVAPSRRAAMTKISRLEAQDRFHDAKEESRAAAPRLQPVTCTLVLLAWVPALWVVTANGGKLGILALPLIAGWLFVAWWIWRKLCPPNGRL